MYFTVNFKYETTSLKMHTLYYKIHVKVLYSFVLFYLARNEQNMNCVQNCTGFTALTLQAKRVPFEIML